MKIVIAGGGKVGYTLARQLSFEGHDVVLIDSDAEVLRAAQEQLDVAVAHGSGASIDVQLEAGVKEADILIAATSLDELNILCCLVARKLGCKNTIARVRKPEYDQQINLLKEELGLSLSINPEKACAREIFRLLQFPSFLNRDQFAKGLVELVELKLGPESVLVGHPLMDIGKLGLSGVNILICAVERAGEVVIPGGTFVLEENDKITVAASATELARLLRALRIPRLEIDSAMIMGGGRITEYLSAMLIRAHVQVTVIEKDRARCDELSGVLRDATIIHGDGTDQELLLAEGVSKTDALVTLTGIDEENLIVSMFGNYVGVKKTITKINRTEYAAVFADKGIDTIVSPRMLTAEEIISYVRAMSSAMVSAVGSAHGGAAGSVVTLYRIADGKAEAAEFFIKGDAPFLHKPLHSLKLHKSILVASIIRHRKVIIPKGNDHLERGDSVVVVTAAAREIMQLSDIFAE